MYAPLSSESDNEGENDSTHERAPAHAEEVSEGAAGAGQQAREGEEHAREHTPPAVEHAVVFSNRFDSGALADSFLPEEAEAPRLERSSRTTRWSASSTYVRPPRGVGQQTEPEPAVSVASTAVQTGGFINPDYAARVFYPAQLESIEGPAESRPWPPPLREPRLCAHPNCYRRVPVVFASMCQELSLIHI